MHLRQDLRDQAVALATGLATTGARAYNSRIFPVDQTELPCWIVTTEEGDEAEDAGMGGAQDRVFRVVFVGQARAASGELLAELLDTMAEELETVVTRQAFTGAAQAAYRSTEFELDAEQTDQALGGMRVTYEVTFFVTQGAPSA